MSTEELRKAVDSSVGSVRTALLAMPFSSAAQSDLDTIAQALRDQEAEIAELKRERTLANGWAGDAVIAARTALSNANDALSIWADRAEKAEALLREALVVIEHYMSFEPTKFANGVQNRITAHLGGEHAQS